MFLSYIYCNFIYWISGFLGLRLPLRLSLLLMSVSVVQLLPLLAVRCPFVISVVCNVN